MEDDYDSNKRIGKTYVSKGLPDFYDKSRMVRIASKVFEPETDFGFAKIKDEITIRITSGNKKLIKATFWEDSRKLKTLNLQGYTGQTGKPHNGSFCLIGQEINDFVEFVAHIQSYMFENQNSVNITNEDLKKLALSNNQIKDLMSQNPDVLNEIIKSELTKKDLVAVGYRKKQLEEFSNLLNSETAELIWQNFFEKNNWIFGYGLSYIFLTSLEKKKLEQYVSGRSVAGVGKEVDGLMKTRGLISSLCFIEIKTHRTPLLENSKPIRSGCWAPSVDLTRAVAQIQGTVSMAIQNIKSQLSPADNLGNPTGEQLFNYQPKSYLVIGSLDEFRTTENLVNIDKYRSFELYRKNITNPEIITFDELKERASHIVNNNQIFSDTN